MMDLSLLTDEEMVKFQKETLRRLIAIAQAEGRPFAAVAYKSGMGIMMDMVAETDVSLVEGMNNA